jgi:phage terminase large subunit-like protein
VRRPSARALAWLVCGITVAILLALAVLALADPQSRGAAHVGPHGPQPGDVPQGDAAIIVFESIAFASIAVVGGFVAARRPRNPVGWLFSGLAFSWSLGLLASALYWHFAFGNPRYPTEVNLLAWLPSWTYIPALGPAAILTMLLFPTGAPPSPRWRPVGWIALGAGLVATLSRALAPGALTSADFAWVDNPLAIHGLGLAAVADASFVICILMAPLAVASLVVRYRRSQGVERLQLKWVTTAFCIAVAAIAATLPLNDAGWPVLLAGLLLISGAVGVALLRYRLYDIDVVINRALVYGALTATLAATYVGSVLLLQLALSGITSGSDLAIAVSTLAVAAAFRPARTRIQEGVDQRFYRRRYDAQLTLEEFSTRLRDQVDLAALDAELRSVVAETMQPAHVSLWLREGVQR